VEDALRNRFFELIEQGFRESIQAKEALCRTGKDHILAIAEMIVRAFRGNQRLFLFGNGGSAADAQHLAAEFVNRFQMERRPLPAIALTVDTSILTSIGNDYRFEDVFLKQLQALAQPGDVALGISTSGRSPNVVTALKWARSHGVHTVGWSGAAETEMDVYSDIILHVDALTTARVQECHITAGHVVCGLVEEMLFGEVMKSE
jgi:D-sedoheptulose 7-phosphate isomerase